MSPTVPASLVPLAEGFNPRHLPNLTPPVAGVRSWEWLADPSVAPEQKQAYLEQFRRGIGTVDPFERGLLVEPLPRAEVVDSHLTQDIVWELAGAPPVTVRFGAATNTESTGDFPFSGPVAVIGTVAPSRDAVRALGRRIREELTAYLAEQGIRLRTATAVDAGRRWHEPIVIAEYVEESFVRIAARLHLQPFYSVWRVVGGRTHVEVVDVATGDVVAHGYGRVGQLGTRTCPMIPGSQCGDLCRAYGGPWTSHSIHAMARWEQKRARMIDALGCDTCGDGAITLFMGEVMGGGRWTHSAAPEPGRQSRHDRLVAPEVEPG
jgi:hypothetical protein